jgi:hypothetical protein
MTVRKYDENGKIIEISTEDWAALAEFREEAREKALSTETADRPKAERAIRDAYIEQGLNPPKEFHWYDSPLEGARAAQRVGGPWLRDQIRAQLGAQLGAQLWDLLWDLLLDQLGAQLWDLLFDQLGAQLRDQILDQLRDQLRGQLWAAMKGSQESYWLSYHHFLRSHLGIPSTANPEPHLRAALETGGWWWPGKEIVICTDRPEVLKFDAERRLHSETGPAIRYRDGFSVYSWHGTRIPKEWIEAKDKVDPSLALTWENVEQRRCLAEILGWETVLHQLSPVVVDEDRDPMIGTLLRVDLPDSPGEQFLRVLCGTGRTFVLPVPPDMVSAAQANAWTYGVTIEDIKQIEVRT